MTVLVSVVVATYNSGSGINKLVDSLDRQSLGTDEFEVVFVDDGSTDGTPARLQRLAASRPNVRTAQIPNSGWPGRPRNIGLDLAVGEYVFFADHDDFFGDEALARMYDYAKANKSDVLVAREQYIGRTRPLGAALFARNRPQVDLSWWPLAGLMTPHKLFRRAFLHEHGLRFPEGRRRLEDHALILPAYFAADVISVLADYPCYFWVIGGESANYSHGIDPEAYYPYLEEVLDIVEAHTEPGPRRDALLARWYSGKVLGFVERSAARPAPQQQDELLAITSELARTRFASCDPYLNPVRRVLSVLLRAGDRDRVVALGHALAGVTATPVVRSCDWRDGSLQLDVTVTMRYADGRPAIFRREEGRVLWVPPIDVGEHVDPSLLDVTDELPKSHVGALVRHSRLGIFTMLEGDTAQSLVEDDEGNLVLSLAHRVAVDVRMGETDAPLRAGRWQLRLTAGVVGLNTTAALPAPASRPEPALIDGRPVVPFVTSHGNLALAVDVAQASLVARARVRPGDVRVTHGVSGSRLVIDLPRVHVSGNGERRCAVRIGKLPVPARLVADAAGARVESWLSAVPGRHALAIELGGKVRPLGLTVVVAQDGSVRVRVQRERRTSTPRPPVTHPRLRAAVGRVPGLRHAYAAVRRRPTASGPEPAPTGARGARGAAGGRAAPGARGRN